MPPAPPPKYIIKKCMVAFAVNEDCVYRSLQQYAEKLRTLNIVRDINNRYKNNISLWLEKSYLYTFGAVFSDSHGLEDM